MTVMEVDKELIRLNDLVKDYQRDSYRWNIVWERIDRLLDERVILGEEDTDECSSCL